MSYDYNESRSRLDEIAKVYEDRSRFKDYLNDLHRENRYLINERDGVSDMENAQCGLAESYDDTHITGDKLILELAISKCYFLLPNTKDQLQEVIGNVRPDAPLTGLQWIGYAWRIYLSAEPAGSTPLNVALLEPNREMDDRRDITEAFRVLLESLVSACLANSSG